jgi:protein-disulfide isomerase
MDDPNNQNIPAKDKDDVIVLKRSYVYAILLPLAFVVGLAAGYLFWGKQPETTVVSEPTQVEVVATEVTAQTRYEIPIDDDPSLGPEDAPIVIVEFSDFNCGYCQKWYTESLQQLLDAYPDQILFVYRDYPILSEESQSAAEAAQCAYEQGAFWEYHDALFTRSESLGYDTYLLFAQDLNLDTEDFQDCLDSERYKEEVENDALFAAGLGISGTPTFFINGIPLVGAQPIETFIMVIDDELDG